MYTYIIIFIIISMLIVAFYNTFIVKHNRKEQQKAAGQPTHFDLLDDNGEPIKEPKVKIAIGSGDSDAPVQELKYFCIKDKGYYVTVWPKDYNHFDMIRFCIAGIEYRDNIDEYLGESVGVLEAEPTNPYDPNAIKILAHDGHHVGYVPKDMTDEVPHIRTTSMSLLPIHRKEKWYLLLRLLYFHKITKCFTTPNVIPHETTINRTNPRRPTESRPDHIE